MLKYRGTEKNIKVWMFTNSRTKKHGGLDVKIQMNRIHGRLDVQTQEQNTLSLMLKYKVTKDMTVCVFRIACMWMSEDIGGESMPFGY